MLVGSKAVQNRYSLMENLPVEKRVVVKEVVHQLVDEHSGTFRARTRKSEIASRGWSIDEREAELGILVLGEKRLHSGRDMM